MNYHLLLNNKIIQSTAQKNDSHSSSKKSNEKEVSSNLQHRRVKQQPKFHLGQLVRTSDIRRVFSKGDSTNKSYNLCTVIETILDTIPSDRINYLPKT